jgi:hypothetical protein
MPDSNMTIMDAFEDARADEELGRLINPRTHGIKRGTIVRLMDLVSACRPP